MAATMEFDELNIEHDEKEGRGASIDRNIIGDLGSQMHFLRSRIVYKHIVCRFFRQTLLILKIFRKHA